MSRARDFVPACQDGGAQSGSVKVGGGSRYLFVLKSKKQWESSLCRD